MILHAFGSSDIGKLRARNEDAFVVRPELGLFAVADGMGGHVAGDVASRSALDVLVAEIADQVADESAMRAAIEAANLAVWRRSESEPDKAGMGTTVTAAAFTPDVSSCVIGHVGDSRLYRLRAHQLEQLTRDHTAAQELIDQGRLTREGARRHPLSSLLQRSVGTRPTVVVDVMRSAVERGDRYLLCSDGLSGMIGDDDAAAILSADLPLEAVARRLIELANVRGGPDNITAILIDVA